MKQFYLLFLILVGIFVTSVTHMALAETNSTSQNLLQKMFNPYIPYNSYNDSIHNFSISPPDGWAIQTQSNEKNNALVVFSNQNSTGLANLSIYYNYGEPIPPSIFALPDNQILDQTVEKLYDPLQFAIIQKNIQRFSDGFIMQMVSEPKQSTQNTPKIEEFVFWLQDGRQYFLIMLSSQNNYEQNAVAFENSVYTFYVSPEKTPTVPEFGPIATIVLTAMISTTIVLLRIKRP